MMPTIYDGIIIQKKSKSFLYYDHKDYKPEGRTLKVGGTKIPEEDSIKCLTMIFLIPMVYLEIIEITDRGMLIKTCSSDCR